MERNVERLVRALCLMEGYSDKIEMRDPMGVGCKYLKEIVAAFERNTVSVK